MRTPFLFLLILIQIPTLFYGQEWVKEHPLPSNSNINALHFSNTNLGWWAGSEGALFVSANGGEDWAPQDLPTNVDLYGLTFLDALEGWAVGDNATILHTLDGGNDWQIQTTSNNASLAKVQFIDAQNGWVMSTLDSILKTTNGGNTWQAYAVASNVSLTDFKFIDVNIGWVCGDTSVWKTTDGGQSWVEQPTGGGTLLEAVDFVDENYGWLVGADGMTYRTTDGGNNWTAHEVIIAANNLLLGVHFQDSLNGIIFRDYMVLETSDGGVNWAFLTGGRYSQFFFLDTAHVWAIAQPSTGRRILKSTNGAQNFTTLLQTTVNTLKDIAVIDKDSLWVVGGGGPLYSNDGGRKWKRRGTGVSNPCYEVEFSEDGQTGWMTTTWLRLYRTIDGGDNWVRSQSLGSGIITERLYELDFINDQTGWVGSSYGTIYKTTNSGQSWQSIASGFLQTQLLEFAKPQIGWMTDANNTYKTIDGGANWNVDLAFDDSNLSALYFVDSLFGWAAGRGANQNTLLLHTNNTGNTWVKDTLPGIGPIKEVHFANHSKGWLITNNNEIWASQDGGQTWILEQSSLTHPIYALGAADSTHAWAVGDQSTIFRYQDCAIALPIINNTGGTLTIAGSYNSYQWLLNGDSILGATQASYLPTVAGIYTLIVHDAVDCHKTAFAFLVDNNVLSTTALLSSEQLATFKLYPNPSTGTITLEFEENIQATELRIVHLSGQVVAVYTNLESKMELDCSQLPNGVYILEANGAKGKQVQKLIIQR